MRVLGIDCGTEKTGFGVIESDGVSHRMLTAGVIRTRTKDPLGVRLLEIRRGLMAVVEQYRPGMGAVEEVFGAVNTRTALKLAHVRGVALLVIAESGLDCGEYSPLEVKMSVVGYGRAEKEQVRLMVQSLCKLTEQIESFDACDALAVAICHATHYSSQLRRGAAV
jgi:crossover junction endodeoxyribonuclease RuvC